MSNTERRKKLEELAKRRVAEESEEQKKAKTPTVPAGSQKEKKPPTARSSPVKNKQFLPLKSKGGRAATLNEYEADGFIVDDEEEGVLDSESQASSGGEHFTASEEISESDYSDGIGSSKRKKRKVVSSAKKSKGSKKKTTKRKKIESNDEDSTEEEVVKKKLNKKSKKKKGTSDEEELSDINRDELDELDTSQIIGRRTRGKKIDFTGQDPYDDDE